MVKRETLANLTTRAKVQLGAIFVGVLAMQVDAVKDVVMPLVAHHPHVSSIVGGVFTAVTLLQNPAIQSILGIEHEETLEQHADGTATQTDKKTITLTESK